MLDHAHKAYLLFIVVLMAIVIYLPIADRLEARKATMQVDTPVVETTTYVSGDVTITISRTK